ncbi:autotransporter outer membrane beta-barrel domain-containing protein [Microbulbifer taiwanensis]|uniref:autotransporter outer membrane beta-barrel domain-containing protein n=1 Tax=Microbulbifer taiwanensis TaxID=986746 RepID=UPI00361BDF27
MGTIYRNTGTIKTWLSMGFCAVAVLTSVGERAWAECSPGNTGTAGADQILCDKDNDAEGADVETFGGDDTLDLNGGTMGTVNTGDGDDTINIGGADDDITEPPDPDEIDEAEEEEEEDFDPGELELNEVIIEVGIDAGAGNDTIIMDNRQADVGTFLGGGGIDGGSGDDTIELLDGLAFHVWGGDGNDNIVLDGGFVFNYIDGGDGDDIIHWDEGIANEVRGGNGSDQLRIDAFSYESEAILDGGDDVHAGDGYIDTLFFILDYKQDASLLRNWERVVIWGSSKMEFSGSLDVGGGVDADGNDLGLDILFGGLVQFIPRHFVVTGNIANAGTLDLGFNGRFDTLTLSKDASGRYGDYIGKDGRLWLDVRLNADDSPADLFKIQGSTSGQTFIRVTNRHGIGAVTSGDGIKLVQVDGNSAEEPLYWTATSSPRTGSRQPSAVPTPTHCITTENRTRKTVTGTCAHWRSTRSSRRRRGGPLAAGRGDVRDLSPAAALLNQPTSLRSRVGNRFWMGSSYKDVSNCDYATSVERAIDGGGAWVRAGARKIEVDPMESTSRTHWEQDYFRLQLGVDVPLNFTMIGTQPIASVALHYGDSENDLESFYGDGNIDVKGYGVSGFMTWYGTQGTYFDAQLLLNWFDSDITASDLRDLQKGRTPSATPSPSRRGAASNCAISIPSRRRHN